jgi:hypothetical protein
MASKQRRMVPWEGESSKAAQANRGWVSAIIIVTIGSHNGVRVYIAMNPPHKMAVG